MAEVFLVSVSGACSRSGKTACAVSLLEALPRQSAVAVKFTTTEDVFERCPRGKPCVVCDIDVPFRLVEDRAVLQEPGTDTERLGTAGASRVIWVITRHSAASAAWQLVEARLRGAETVVMEGSTVVALARPQRNVFVVHPFLSPAHWKPTSGSLLGEADVVVVNRPRGESREPDPAVLEAVARHRGRRSYIVADVTRPPALWAPGLFAGRDSASA